MEFKIQKKHSHNRKNYNDQDFQIAYDFSQKAYKEFGSIIKSIVLFGSLAKQKNPHVQDIDILIVVDDVTQTFGPEVIEAYRILVEKIVQETSQMLHISTLKLTNFWEYVRVGDPIIINILREGVPIIDTGFFEPVQFLLLNGKIRPTPESVHAYYGRVPISIHNSKWHVMQGTVDLYWAVIDAAHAALMSHGEMPPSPSEMSDMLTKTFGNKGLEKKYIEMMNEFYVLSKAILHREKKDITGKEYDMYLQKAEEFVKRMKQFIK